jgi:hypothetical protein
MKKNFVKIIITCLLLIFVLSCSKPSNTLKLDKASYAVNEVIKVTFSAQSGLDKHAWIGLIPSNIKHGNEELNDQNDVSYQYLDGRTSGTLTFKAPNDPGNYDFRLNEADGKPNALELASVSFTVK